MEAVGAIEKGRILDLNKTEEQEHRKWAREHLVPGIDTIDEEWHPVIKNEFKIMCRQMLGEPTRAMSSVCIMRNVHGKVLLLNRAFAPMGYCLPGGHIEEDEDPMDACYREVLEETGMLLPGGSLRLVKETYSISGTHVMVYSCDMVVSEHIILSHEHTDFAFVDPFNMNLTPAGRTLKFLEGVV